MSADNRSGLCNPLGRTEGRQSELHAARLHALNARRKLTEAKAAAAKPLTAGSPSSASDPALDTIVAALAAQDAHLQEILSQDKAA